MNSGESGRAEAAHWLTVHDELLQGIAHTLSNRVATIGAAAYMLGIDGANVVQQSTILGGECESLEALLHAMRDLPRRVGIVAEPVMPGDVVRAALALRAQCGELREIDYLVTVDSSIMPTYGNPTALQHAVLVALHAADRYNDSYNDGAQSGKKQIAIDVSGNADIVTFAVKGGGSDADGDATTAEVDRTAATIQWLISLDGGKSHSHPGGGMFEVPTLLAARRNR